MTIWAVYTYLYSNDLLLSAIWKFIIIIIIIIIIMYCIIIAIIIMYGPKLNPTSSWEPCLQTRDVKQVWEEATLCWSQTQTHSPTATCTGGSGG